MNAKLLVTAALLAGIPLLHSQEPQAIPADELAKATQLLMDANTRLGDLPLKLELAPDQANGFKAGEAAGAILIPDRRLKAEKSAKVGKKRKNKGAAVPVGQLWIAKLAPMEKESVLPNDKLRLVMIPVKDTEMEVAVFALGIERAGKKAFQLALYGKDDSPVLRVPMTVMKSRGAAPVVMAARKTGEEAGVLELMLLGRFKAEIPVGKTAL